jgi:hypothetical protein
MFKSIKQFYIDFRFKSMQRALKRVRCSDAERLNAQRELDALDNDLAALGTNFRDNIRNTLAKELTKNLLPFLVPFADAYVITPIFSMVVPSDLPEWAYFLCAFLFAWLVMHAERLGIRSLLMQHTEKGNPFLNGDPIQLSVIKKEPSIWLPMVLLPALGLFNAIFTLIVPEEGATYNEIGQIFIANIIFSIALLVFHYLVIVHYDTKLKADVYKRLLLKRVRQSLLVQVFAKKFVDNVQKVLIPRANRYIYLIERYKMRDPKNNEQLYYPILSRDLIAYVNTTAEFEFIEIDLRHLRGIPQADMHFKETIRRYQQFAEEQQRLQQRIMQKKEEESFGPEKINNEKEQGGTLEHLQNLNYSYGKISKYNGSIH